MKPLYALLGSLCVGSVMLSACSPSGDAAPAVSTPLGDAFPQNHFLEYLNHGNYTLVAATATPGQTGTFTLKVDYDDGSSQTFAGSWPDASGSAGKVSRDDRNPAYGISLAGTTGFTATLTSSADNYLYLLDVTGAVIDQDDNGGGGTNARIRLAEPTNYSSKYTSAYYKAIDPNYGSSTNDLRATFDGWKSANGFDQATAGQIHHVIMRDALDLGYGRDIYFLQHADCSVTVYVKNYQATGVPGQDYGPLNLDAAINQVEKYHVGTNALEWGPPIPADGKNASPPVAAADPANCQDTGNYFLRFYSFDPHDSQERRTTVDIDTRGDKAMPIPCMTCHGARADPLLSDGSFRLLTQNIDGKEVLLNRDALGHLQPLRVDSFDFSTVSGYTRADQESEYAKINQAIYDTYYWNSIPPTDYGFWNSTTARTIMANWYKDASSAQSPDPASLTERFELSVFQGDYVPDGWKSNAVTGTPPAGAENLYADVIANNCRLCHLLRGLTYQSDIDFQSYDKFLSYSPRIERLVYDDGLMPLAELTYDDFYSVSGRPEELASFIPGFSRYDSSGAVQLPGRPVANPGPDRTVPSPADLSASASILADQYEWKIVSQPDGSNASLTTAGAAHATLTADTDGQYTVQLRVADNGTWSDPALLQVTIDSTTTPPSQLTFHNDIQPLLEGSCGSLCHHPHVPNAAQPLPPVYYCQPGKDPNCTDDTDAVRDVYTDVMGRVNLTDPASSLILEKPSGHSHGGKLISGFDLNGDHSKYDLIQNWILGGAQR